MANEVKVEYTETSTLQNVMAKVLNSMYASINNHSLGMVVSNDSKLNEELFKVQRLVESMSLIDEEIQLEFTEVLNHIKNKRREWVLTIIWKRKKVLSYTVITQDKPVVDEYENRENPKRFSPSYSSNFTVAPVQ